MAKMLVETKGDIQVVGHGDEMHARHNRPSVVVSNRFMSTHVSDGNLVMLAQLVDEASDKEFAAAWAKASAEEDPKVRAAAQEEIKTSYAKAYAPGGKEKAPAPAPAPKPGDDKK